jgi:hypothetical protein
MLRRTAENYRDVGEVAMIDAVISRLTLGFLGVCLGAVGISAVAFADAPVTPFYYASATAVEPQIATLVVGVNENVGQAVVSGDRKYVTMDMDASLMGNAGIRSFTYQRGGLGFVGSVAPQAISTGGNSLTPSIAASAWDIAPAISALDKPGMVLIAPLER